MLGLPPGWYKDPAYRARIVREPRALLAELGLELDDGVDVQVWDSSSEVRYMVLPERPAGTEGLSEEELAALVTRDAMVGVAKVAGAVRGHAGRGPRRGRAGGPAPVQRRAGLRRAVGEQGVRVGAGAARRRGVRVGGLPPPADRSRRRLGARPSAGGVLELLPVLADGAGGRAGGRGRRGRG